MNPPSAHPKFVFDTVFEETRAVRPARPKKVYEPEEVEAIRAQAYAEGQRSVSVQAQQVQAHALAQIAEAVRAALSGLASVAHEHRAGSARLAMAAAGKIADAALARFPEAPAAAALAALAREVEAVPRLVVRTAPDRVDAMQEALGSAAQAAGYPGQIVVRADPGLPQAAFVFDWGDGSAAFDPVVAAQRVSEALESALAAEGQHAESLNLSNPPSQGPDHG